VQQDVGEHHPPAAMARISTAAAAASLATMAVRAYCLTCRSTKASSAVLSTSIHSTRPTQNITLAREDRSSDSAMPTSMTAVPETQWIFMLRWVHRVRSTPLVAKPRERRNEAWGRGAGVSEGALTGQARGQRRSKT
jgi:hypothetical protein